MCKTVPWHCLLQLREMRSSNTKTISKSLSLAAEPPLRSNWRISPENVLKQSQQWDKLHMELQLCFSFQSPTYFCTAVLSAPRRLLLCLMAFVCSLCWSWGGIILSGALSFLVSKQQLINCKRGTKDHFVRWLSSHQLRATFNTSITTLGLVTCGLLCWKDRAATFERLLNLFVVRQYKVRHKHTQNTNKTSNQGAVAGMC